MTAYDDMLNEAKRIDTAQPKDSQNSMNMGSEDNVEVMDAVESADSPSTMNSMESQDTEMTSAPEMNGKTRSMNESSMESVREFVRENPGPTVLIAAGLAWLFVNRERARSRALPLRLKDSAVRLKDTTTEKLGQARESTSETLHHAREATSDRLQHAKEATAESLQQAREATEARAQALQQQALEKARLARERYRHMLGENPLALGAGALIAGLAFGLMLPPTRRENELLGETRDSLMDQAKSIVNEARAAAVNTLRASRDTVEEKLLETKQEVESAVRESLHQAGEAAKDQL